MDFFLNKALKKKTIQQQFNEFNSLYEKTVNKLDHNDFERYLEKRKSATAKELVNSISLLENGLILNFEQVIKMNMFCLNCLIYFRLLFF